MTTPRPRPIPGPPSGLLDFTGRTVVVTGTASGMGAAVLQLLAGRGAVIHALDVTYRGTTLSTIEPALNSNACHRHTSPDRYTASHCDLGDRRSIDQACTALPHRIDVLLNCAGIPNGGRFSGEQVMRVNWLGLRHLTECVLTRMPPGSAVVHIASTAGRGWTDRLETLRTLMEAETFEDGLEWMATHPDEVGDGYVLSKEAVQYYTMWRAVRLLPHGVRMNSVCPGVTDTGIIDDFRRGMGDQIIDHAAAVAGRMAQPHEMAPAILFLADEASSSYINGINLNIDRGTAAARSTNQSDPTIIWSS